METFVGMIMLWPLSWAPQDWAFCDGRLLPIREYQALFGLLAFTYGGDRQTTFGIPDLRGRTIIGVGAGQGLTARTLGMSGGAESVTLPPEALPPHTHPAVFTPGQATAATLQASAAQGTTGDPNGNYLANASGSSATGEAINGMNYIGSNNAGPLSNVAGLTMPSASGTVTIASAGQGQPAPSMPPFFALNYIIALNGLYPNRP